MVVTMDKIFLISGSSLDSKWKSIIGVAVLIILICMMIFQYKYPKPNVIELRKKVTDEFFSDTEKVYFVTYEYGNAVHVQKVLGIKQNSAKYLEIILPNGSTAQLHNSNYIIESIPNTEESIDTFNKQLAKLYSRVVYK